MAALRAACLLLFCVEVGVACEDIPFRSDLACRTQFETIDDELAGIVIASGGHQNTSIGLDGMEYSGSQRQVFQHIPFGSDLEALGALWLQILQSDCQDIAVLMIAVAITKTHGRG